MYRFLLASSFGTSVISSQDEGPLTVLSANAPVIDTSSNSVQAGGTVTVTGHNWVPTSKFQLILQDAQPVSQEIAR